VQNRELASLETGANYEKETGNSHAKATQKVLIAPQKLKRNGVGFETGTTK
jgi:hypothetical protein